MTERPPTPDVPTIAPTWRVDVAALTLLLGVGVLAFGPVFAWSQGLRAGSVGLALALLLTALATWRRWSTLTTMNAAVLGYFVLGGVAALPETTVAGFVPTLSTIQTLARMTYAAWRDLLTASLPASTFTGPAVVPYLATLGLAMLAYGTAVRGRRPLLAVPVALALLVVGILWGTHRAPYALAQGLAFGVLALGWAAWRGQRVRRAEGAVFHDVAHRALLVPRLAAVSVLLLFGAGLAAFAAPLLTPDARHVLRDDVVPPAELSALASPLTEYRHLERDLTAQPLLTVTGLPAGARIRLATMDAYDGNVYRVDGSSAGFQRAGERIDSTSGLDGPTTRIGVTVTGLSGVWVPTVGTTTGIRFTGGNAREQAGYLHYNPITETALTSARIGEGTRYELEARTSPRPADAAIAAATPSSVPLPTPVRVPDVIRDVTARVVGPATTPADQLERIRSYLRAGYYSDGRETPSRSGHTSERIGSLLSQQLLIGDEEQYAVAMALMARQVDLPARVVLGFVPGANSASGATGATGARGASDPATPVTLTGGDARVWVEVAYDGLGWVSYDPTPDRNQKPLMIDPKVKEEPKPQVLPPPEPPRESAPPPVKADEADRPKDPDARSSALERVLKVGAMVAGGLLLVSAPILLILAIKAVRRRRRRTSGTPADRVGRGWSEVVDRATDVGLTVPSRGTRRETALVIDDRYPAAASIALAERIDTHVFGPGEPTEDDVRALWHQVDEALSAVNRSVSARQRWRARVSLRSLRRTPQPPRPARNPVTGAAARARWPRRPSLRRPTRRSSR